MIIISVIKDRPPSGSVMWLEVSMDDLGRLPRVHRDSMHVFGRQQAQANNACDAEQGGGARREGTQHPGIMLAPEW